MISVFRHQRDSAGHEVVEIGMNALLPQIAFIAVPAIFIGITYFALGQGPLGVPWFMIAGPITIGALGFAGGTWMSNRSTVRVTIDASAGKLLVRTSSGQAEMRIADVAKAEFGTEHGRRGPVYRLEFVMKSGERLPATSTYFSAYAQSDRAQSIAAINASLGRPLT